MNRAIKLHMGPRGMKMEVVGRHLPTEYGRAFGKPISGASQKRIICLLESKCLLTGASVAIIGGITNTYTYLPDVLFDQYAKDIDHGASNPLAVVNVMQSLAYYLIRVRKDGMSALRRDPAWLLMLNQLNNISGGREIDFDVYLKASKKINDEK